MKNLVSLLFLAATLVGYAAEKDNFVAVDPGDDAVIFTDDRTMANDIQIIFQRSSSGEVIASTFELYFEESTNGAYETRARPLFSRTVAGAVYDSIVKAVESRDLADLAHRFPPPGLDGWTWRVCRISRNDKKSLSFWCPEYARDISGGELKGLETLLDLGRQVTRTAGVIDLDAFINLRDKPNQAPLPTPVSVTPAAGAPVAPATGAADL